MLGAFDHLMLRLYRDILGRQWPCGQPTSYGSMHAFKIADNIIMYAEGPLRIGAISLTHAGVNNSSSDSLVAVLYALGYVCIYSVWNDFSGRQMFAYTFKRFECIIIQKLVKNIFNRSKKL